MQQVHLKKYVRGSSKKTVGDSKTQGHDHPEALGPVKTNIHKEERRTDQFITP